MRKNLKFLGVLALALIISFAFISCSTEEEDDGSKWQGRGIHYLLQGAWVAGETVPGGPVDQRPHFFISGSQMTYLSITHKVSQITGEDLRLVTREDDYLFLTEPVDSDPVVRRGRTIAALERDLGPLAQRFVSETVTTPGVARIDMQRMPLVGPVDMMVFEVQARTYDNAKRAGSFHGVVDVSPRLDGAHQMIIVDRVDEQPHHMPPPIVGGFAASPSSWFVDTDGPVFTRDIVDVNSAGQYYLLRLRYSENPEFQLMPLPGQGISALDGATNIVGTFGPGERFALGTFYEKRTNR